MVTVKALPGVFWFFVVVLPLVLFAVCCIFRKYVLRARKANLKNTLINLNISVARLWNKIIKILDAEGGGPLNREVGKATVGAYLPINHVEETAVLGKVIKVISLLRDEKPGVVAGNGSLRFRLLVEIEGFLKNLIGGLSRAQKKGIDDLPGICTCMERILQQLDTEIESMDEIFGKPDEEAANIIATEV